MPILENMTPKKLKEKLKEKGHEIKSNVAFLYRGTKDPRMPLHLKLLTLLIVAYIVSPIDIIPDFIPVIGLLDDIILVPILLTFAVSLMPVSLKLEYESDSATEIDDERLSIAGAIITITIWLLLAGWCLYII